MNHADVYVCPEQNKISVKGNHRFPNSGCMCRYLCRSDGNDPSVTLFWREPTEDRVIVFVDETNLRSVQTLENHVRRFFARSELALEHASFCAKLIYELHRQHMEAMK